MLEYEDRVAVVHSTDKGKSFIGFQVCVDHPLTKVVGYLLRNIFLILK